MEEQNITLNAPADLGNIIAKAGVEQVRIVPSIYFITSKVMTIYCSYEIHSRIVEVLKEKRLFVEDVRSDDGR